LALSILSLATLALASAPILSKMKEHKDTGAITTPPHWLTASPHLMGRSLKGVFLTVLVMLIPIAIFALFLLLAELMSQGFIVRHIVTTIVAMCVWLIISVLFYLPLYHVLMKYVMEAPCGYWRTLASNYGCGMRHWGGLFLVFFLSTLLVVLAGLVVTLPANILTYANQQAHQGLLIGDALNMPSYMTVLTFGTCALCSYLEFYVSQVTLVHNYYIYGSIETKEHEKNSIH
jgi:riboflavin transporter FmnP